MTPEQREAIYDAEIAPQLLELGKKCQDHGMGFLVLIDYTGQGDVASTASLPANAPAILRYANALVASHARNGAVNIDSFMFAVMKEARATGHRSLILSQLGIPVDKPSATQ